MIIAGLTGGIGYGKTTFATLLSAQSRSAMHFETWEVVAEVAVALRNENTLHPDPDDIKAVNKWLQPLSDIASLHIHSAINYEQLALTNAKLKQHPEYFDKLFEYLRTIQANPTLANTEITADNKQTFRPLLQWLGGYLVTAGGGVWYQEIVRRIAHLRGAGTDLVTVGGVRYPDDAEQLRNAGAVIIDIKRPSLPERDAQDLTERKRTLITADCSILNNGALDDLAVCASHVYKDLSLRQLQPAYQAKA